MLGFKTAGVMGACVAGVCGVAYAMSRFASQSRAETEPGFKLPSALGILKGDGFRPHDPRAGRHFASSISNLSDAVATSAMLAKDDDLREMASKLHRAAEDIHWKDGAAYYTDKLTADGYKRAVHDQALATEIYGDYKHDDDLSKTARSIRRALARQDPREWYIP
jgi:hypothetical protein